jgi:hypothetical protein
LGSPLSGRRRASTIATELAGTNIIASPIAFEERQDCNEETLMGLSSPVSSNSQEVTQRLSSYGSAHGRTLMDELTAIHSNEWTESTEPASDIREAQESSSDLALVTPSCGARKSSDLSYETRDHTESSKNSTSTSSITAKPAHRRTRSRSINTSRVGCSTSAFDRLSILFGDLWRSPVALARHLIQVAQSRMRIPRTLLNVQWWLVGVLLGPMARRRLLLHNESCEDANEGALLLEDTPARSVVDEEMAYGTMHETPPRSSTGKNGRRRRRTVSKTRCAHRRSKHSPWLWLKFSITLAFAIGAAFKDGPGSLLKSTVCHCRQRGSADVGRMSERMVSS